MISTITNDDEKFLNSFKEETYSTNNLKNQGYIILGSLNFNTNLELNKLIFEKIASEDALNIVRSNFSIDNLFFSENFSDAIDVDFGVGSINNLKFENIEMMQ